MEPKHFESLYPVDTRDEEIEKIVGFIKEGNSCQIIGLPGVGRSNLFGMLAYNRAIREKHFPTKNEWVHFVMVDFSEVRGRSLVDTIKLFFLSLTDSLRERGMMEEYSALQKIFKESSPLQDELVMFQGFKRAIDYLCLEKKRTIIFLFDRFEEYIKTLRPEFFAQMRILRNRAKYRFSILFSLSRPLEDLLEPQLFADFSEFIIGHHVYLPILDGVGVDFRINYLEKLTGKSIPPEVKEEVLKVTAGHGKLTRLSLEAILANLDVILSEAKNLSSKDEIFRQAQDDNLIEFLLEQKIVRGGIYEIWNTLLPAEQEYLASGNEHKATGLEQNLNFLEKVGLLQEGKVQIPLLGEMIRKKQFSDTSKEKIVFAEDTNTIKKGYSMLSDMLTNAEFRLLKHLLQNEAKVIDRDEIIGVVWKEGKSTAGVTDQAIDQLVFRLRRKIEDDPNNPAHLQTVKGRGIRFTA